MKKGHKRKSHEHRKDLAGEFKWGDTLQLVFIVVFFIGLAFDLIFFKLSNSWQELLPWYYRLVVSLFLLFAAVYFGLKSHKIMFEEEREKLMVIDKDVYSRVRHPMYFSSILAYLSFVILSLSVVSILIFFVVIIFYYYLCYYEEQVLIDKLGNEYRSYMKKVPMLFPSFRKKL